MPARKKTINKKGQIFSTDLIISVVAFMVIFIFIFSLWGIYSTRLNENMASEELQLLTFQIIDILMKSRGEPNNWEINPSGAKVIGLRLNPGSIDKDKLNAFLSLEYNQTKGIFNIGRFDYNFKVLDINGSLINNIGLSLNQSDSQVVSVNRFVMVENETKEIRFALWRRY